MKKRSRRQRARSRLRQGYGAQALLQWVFSRGNHLVTCELHQRGTQYLVRLLHHGDLTRAIVATFDAGLAAFQRHAAIAAELRKGGWMLVAYR